METAIDQAFFLALLMLLPFAVSAPAVRSAGGGCQGASQPADIDHISANVIPALTALGVTDEQIKTMMVDNPRNLFLGK